jgi:ATP-dependent Clp protease protease subunit
MILIHGGVGSELAERVCKEILALEAADPKKPIHVYINSPGGEVTSGFAIFDTLRYVRCEIKTIVSGLAASMGSIISLAAKKENRLAMPNSKFLIHQPLISGMIRGSASEIEIHAKDIIKMRERINQLYATETGQPIEVVRQATDRDNWMEPEEALKFGHISRIIKSHAEI